MIDVRDFGALGDGVAKDTAAIQSAIDFATANGGGKVHFAPGCYVTGTIYLKDNVFLDIEPGAVILGSPDKEDYNADDFCPQNRVFAKELVSGAHLIVAVNAKNIGIVGGGKIDGNRKAFYNEIRTDVPTHFKLPEWRPAQMIFLCECKGVTLSGVEMFNACYWTCFLHGCQDATISDLRIFNEQPTPNGDGIDIDCCQRVTVTNCNIDSGDDCITLRGYVSPLQEPRPCQHVTVSNCILRTRCNAFRIGVGDGIVRDCTISNIVFWGTRTAICICSKYSKGSEGVQIENIQFENLRMDCKRMLNLSADIHGVQPDTSKLIRNISIRHVTGKVMMTSLIVANPDRNVKNVSISDVHLDVYGGEGNPLVNTYSSQAEWPTPNSAPVLFYAENIDGIRLKDIDVNLDNATGNWSAKYQLVNCNNGLAEENFLEQEYL